MKARRPDGTSSSLVGRHVQLRGIEFKAELNGQCGKVTFVDAPLNKYTVLLQSGKKFVVNAKHLALRSSLPPASSMATIAPKRTASVEGERPRPFAKGERVEARWCKGKEVHDEDLHIRGIWFSGTIERAQGAQVRARRACAGCVSHSEPTAKRDAVRS